MIKKLRLNEEILIFAFLSALNATLSVSTSHAQGTRPQPLSCENTIHGNRDTVISEEKLLAPTGLNAAEFYEGSLNENQVLLLFNSIVTHSKSDELGLLPLGLLEKFYDILNDQAKHFHFNSRLTLLTHYDELRLPSNPELSEKKLQALDSILSSIDFNRPQLRLYSRPISTLLHHLPRLNFPQKDLMRDYLSTRLLAPTDNSPSILRSFRKGTLNSLIGHFADGRLAYTQEHLNEFFLALERRHPNGDRLIDSYSIKELSLLLFFLNKLPINIPQSLLSDIQESLIFKKSPHHPPKITTTTERNLSFIITELFKKDRHFSNEFMQIFSDFLVNGKIQGWPTLDSVSDRDITYLLIFLSMNKVNFPEDNYTTFVEYLLFPSPTYPQSRITALNDRNFFEALYAIVLHPYEFKNTQKQILIDETLKRVGGPKLFDAHESFGPRFLRVVKALSVLEININSSFVVKLQDAFVNNRPPAGNTFELYDLKNMTKILEILDETNFTPSKEFQETWRKQLHLIIDRNELTLSIDQIASLLHLFLKEPFKSFYDERITTALQNRAIHLLKTEAPHSYLMPIKSVALLLPTLSKLPHLNVSMDLINAWINYTLKRDSNGRKMISHFEPRELGAALIHFAMIVAPHKRLKERANQWVEAWLEEALTIKGGHPKVFFFDNQRFVNSTSALAVLDFPRHTKLLNDWFPHLLGPSFENEHRLDTFNELDLVGVLAAFGKLGCKPPPDILEKWFEVFLRKTENDDFQLSQFSNEQIGLITGAMSDLELHVPNAVLKRVSDLATENLNPKSHFNEFRQKTHALLYLTNNLYFLNKTLENHLINSFERHHDHEAIHLSDVQALLRIFSFQGFKIDDNFFSLFTKSLENLGLDSIDDNNLIFFLHQMLTASPDYSFELFQKYKNRYLRALANPQLKASALHSFLLFYRYQTWVLHRELPEINPQLLESYVESHKRVMSNDLQPMSHFQDRVTRELRKRFEEVPFEEEYFIEETASAVDLYDSKHKLIIQIDGIHHFMKDHDLTQFDRRIKDQILDEILATKGYQVVRIPYYLWNDPSEQAKILNSIEGLLKGE